MSKYDDETTYAIGELAREFDITPRSIRFYEEQGLMSPSRTGQNRVYLNKDRVRLKLILRGKRSICHGNHVGCQEAWTR